MKLQHGKGSAMDATAVIYGGVHRIQGAARERLSEDLCDSVSEASGWYWTYHGVPQSKTGECVADVRRRFGGDHALWSAFEKVTERLESCLLSGDDPQGALKENHALLCRIGVVPERAQGFL